MIAVRQTTQFAKWLAKLKDLKVKARILTRIDRLQAGNPGDVKNLKDGVSELKIDYGPGYRVYFARRGEDIILLLYGGDKRTQETDIAEAKKIARELATDAKE